MEKHYVVLSGEVTLVSELNGVITEAESGLLQRAAELRRKAIMVDDFPKDFGRTEVYQTTQAVTFEALARKGEQERRGR